MKVLDDGNITWGVCVTLIVLGVVVMGLTIEFAPSSRWSVLPLLIGFGMVAVGGLSCRARLLHLKPFDNSYKKARKSYESENDDEGAGR